MVNTQWDSSYMDDYVVVNFYTSTIKEIATALGVSMSTVYRAIQRLRRKKRLPKAKEEQLIVEEKKEIVRLPGQYSNRSALGFASGHETL